MRNDKAWNFIPEHTPLLKLVNYPTPMGNSTWCRRGILYRPTQIARAHSRTKRRTEEEEEEEEEGGRKEGRKEWKERNGRIKHCQVCTKRASITSEEETMRTARKTIQSPSKRVFPGSEIGWLKYSITIH